MHELRELHEQQYDIEARRTKRRIQQHWTHLEAFFPAPTPITAVTETRLDDYAQQRLAAKASRQTVNHELSALRRGFNLAIEKHRLAKGMVPSFTIPAVANARDGFFEDGDFAAVLLALPAWMQPVIRFLRYTGWRVSEALTLTWDRVEWERQGIRLSARHTKAKQARLFPFGGAPDLKAVLDAQWATRDGVCVFQRDGQPIPYDTLQHRFQATCAAIGVDRIMHDLRRTAARDFIAAGVDRADVKLLCGWNTDSVFERYLIRNDADLAAAVAKRFTPANGKSAANQPPSTAPAPR